MLLLLACGTIACTSYDPKLIPPRDAAGGIDQPDAEPIDASVDAAEGGGPDCSSGSSCTLDHATAVCVGSECLITACDEGHVDCNAAAADGCEAMLDSVGHCGSCQSACEFANAEPRCAAGSCEIEACAERWADCDSREQNGCERRVDTLNDCGGCGASCAAPNALTTCASGQCRFVGCAAGYGDCNGDRAMLGAGDGCEMRVDTPAHCGACETQCAGATPYCSGGRCTSVVCDAGRADCDDDNSFCEVDLRSLANCGACGVACGPLANATATCASGQCAASCRSGYRDCDSTLSNGCETDVRTNSDCGTCGVVCGFANASATCASGSCVFGGCNPGYGDCNANLADGCEQRLNSGDHCGACAQPCSLASAATSCSSGTCQVGSCQAGFGNCDRQGDNGCEIDLANNPQHCGSCNAACGSNQTCCNGACVDTRSDEAHCGNCGAVCAAGGTCCSGACKDLASDFDNCGSCGSRCDGDNTNRCSVGECRCGSDGSCPPFFSCCSRGCEFGLGC